jgi:hypothetical protein
LNQKIFKLDINNKAVKKILLTSLVLISVMAVLLYLNGVSIIAQETNIGIDTNNITAQAIDNMTGDDNATEPEAGMISRKD